MFFWLLAMWFLAVECEPRRRAGGNLQVKGVVSLERANSMISSARPMDLLYVGDKLTTKSANQAVLVFLEDGHQEEVLTNAVATIGKTNCDPDSAVKRLSPKLQGKGMQTGLNEIKQSGAGRQQFCAATESRKQSLKSARSPAPPLSLTGRLFPGNQFPRQRVTSSNYWRQARPALFGRSRRIAARLPIPKTSPPRASPALSLECASQSSCRCRSPGNN